MITLFIGGNGMQEILGLGLFFLLLFWGEKISALIKGGGKGGGRF